MNSDPFYVGLDAGVCLQQDVKLIEGGGMGTAGDKVVFDPGVRVDVLCGYKLNHSIAAELESGFSYNQVSTVGGSPLSQKVHLYQVPILANAVYNLKVMDKVTGFVGLGAGGVVTFGDAGTWGNDTEVQFGCQAKTGVKYAIMENLDVSFTYKFLGTTCHKWSDDLGTIKSDPTFSHSLMLGLTLKF